MLVILALLGTVGRAQVADLAVTGARIYTGNSESPQASAVAVKGGRILAIGADVGKYIGASTTVIRARNSTIVPGLIDSHGHMAGLGDMLETFDLRHVATVQQVADLVRKAAASRPAGEWIRGHAWDQTNWGGQFPTADPLTAAAPNHPVFLSRVDGHAAWVNRKAIEIAGISASTPDPAGGKIIRDAKGNPTGVLIDRAQGLVSSKIPPAGPAQTERLLSLAAKKCASVGLTTVHDAGIGRPQLEAYRRLIAQKGLPIRIYAMIGGEGELWREYLKKGPELGDRLTVRAIKLMADGAMGSRGAAFWQPYSDDPGNSGLLMLKKEDIERVGRDAVAHGFQVCTHAIGDRANRIALDGYAAALGGKNERRFRIEHAQAVSLPDFALFANYNIIASMQSTHATSDMRWAEQRLGPDRVAGSYAPKRFLDLGVTVANGSDFPVEDPNPLWGFFAAITRQDHQGKPPGGWRPDQKMTREEAFKSWTSAGAYAAFEEKTKGTLEPGKLADFVMLTQDIMTVPPAEILKTRVTMTVVGGEIAYQER